MTEDEAKTKWCHRDNMAPGSKLASTCIGSACMAWRWSWPVRKVEAVIADQKPAGEGWYEGLEPNEWERLAEADPPTSGFCGLAGAQ